MALMPLTDSMFLLVETREHPMHVGGLQLFELPDGAGPDYLNRHYHDMVAGDHVNELFRRKPRTGLSNLGPWSWRPDDGIDLEYHVRHSALPSPCRVRELLELVSRWHGTLLDRHRPLWELHMIEGLEGNRFAMYTKVHHAMLDGVAALRWMQRSLSPDPDQRDMPAPFALPSEKPEESAAREPQPDVIDEITAAALRALHVAGDVAGMPGALASLLRKGLAERETKLPYQAPRSMLNGSITGARRFAAQDFAMARIDRVRRTVGATLNDVVLAMSAGALRRYLLAMDALPEEALVAAVPVSLRPKLPQTADTGNAIGFALCDLATDEPDPAKRLVRIQRSMNRAKENYAELSPLQVLALSALQIAPLGLSPVPGLVDHIRPPFNIIISNVPGPRQPLYWNGARMTGVYPVSVVLDGQALNITVTTYDTSLEFGLTGCRRSVPHLQWLLTYVEESLAELEP